jgi:heme/copper-type cytochrome/quinol oxidase subunit 2
MQTKPYSELWCNYNLLPFSVVEDECKEEEYLVIIIVLAILVIILLVIVVCLVVYRATKNKKEKSGILYEKPNGKDQDMDENETRF